MGTTSVKHTQSLRALLWLLSKTINPSIAEATATLKARLGSASNDLDHDDGSDHSPISAGLGISHDDTSGQVMFNTSSQADKVPDINLPENSTDSNWPDIDDSFWDGLSPYPQAASALESPSALITPPPGLPQNISPLPPITPPPGLPRNISQPAPIAVPLQDLPTPLQNSPTLPPTTTVSSESTRIQAPFMDFFQPTPILAPQDSPMLPPAALPSSTAPVSSPSTIPDQRSQPPAPVEPPTPVEGSVLRRTGRRCVPSSRNVIANSIGENCLIASKRHGPAGEDGVSGHKKKQKV